MKIPTYKCLRCGKVWVPRKVERPRQCPKCKSPYWDRERKKESPPLKPLEEKRETKTESCEVEE